MGHHGSHLEFCEQSENCFWGSKIFPIKYMTKKEHFKKKIFWAVVGGGGGGIYYSKNDGFLEQVKNLYKVSSYVEKSL